MAVKELQKNALAVNIKDVDVLDHELESEYRDYQRRLPNGAKGLKAYFILDINLKPDVNDFAYGVSKTDGKVFVKKSKDVLTTDLVLAKATDFNMLNKM